MRVVTKSSHSSATRPTTVEGCSTPMRIPGSGISRRSHYRSARDRARVDPNTQGEDAVMWRSERVVEVDVERRAFATDSVVRHDDRGLIPRDSEADSLAVTESSELEIVYRVKYSPHVEKRHTHEREVLPLCDVEVYESPTHF